MSLVGLSLACRGWGGLEFSVQGLRLRAGFKLLGGFGFARGPSNLQDSFSKGPVSQ